MRHPLAAAASSMLALALATPATGLAQAAAPDGSVTLAAATDPEVSDNDVIRWAAREIARADGRLPSGRAPVPPDDYLGRSSAVASTAPAALQSGPQPDALRLLAEVASGALGALIGGGAGAFVVWIALEAGASDDWLVVAGEAAVMLGALAISGGVALAGEATGGRGNLGHALLGLTVGSIAALPLVVLGLSEDAPAAAALAGGALPLTGAVVGYEIGHASGAPSATTAYLSPTVGGALAGVYGPLR